MFSSLTSIPVTAAPLRAIASDSSPTAQPTSSSRAPASATRCSFARASIQAARNGLITCSARIGPCGSQNRAAWRS
jgi:hypothetical protein